MQTLENSHSPFTYINKILSIVIFSACITFALFALMQQLIANKGITRLETIDAPLINIFYTPEEEVTREKIRLKPKIKPLVKPEAMPTLPNTETSLSLEPGLYAGNIVEPSIELGINPSFATDNGGARPIVRVEPKYPVVAARDGLEGWVRLQFSITSQGTVDNIQVIESQPKRVFDQAAKRALSKWKYKPNIQAGKAQKQAGMMVMLDFKLDS